MDALDGQHIWGQIPPEEKFEMMAHAHSQGVAAAIAGILIGCTLAVGLRLESLMWGALLFSPIIFQGAAAKAWRDIRPRAMLEYLAARSATRRFAFSLQSSKLGLTVIFRGSISDVFDEQNRQEELEQKFTNARERSVWIALFHDAVVVISEQPGGARLELGHLLNAKLQIEGFSPSGEGEYARDRQVILKIPYGIGTKSFRLSSRYPAAMVVFEKKMLRQLEEASLARDFTALAEVPAADEDEDTSYFKLPTD